MLHAFFFKFHKHKKKFKSKKNQNIKIFNPFEQKKYMKNVKKLQKN